MVALKKMQHIDIALRPTGLVIGVDQRLLGRIIERDDAGVVEEDAIDGAGAEAEDEAYHPRTRVGLGAPDIEIGRVGHPGCMREEQVAAVIARHTLNENRHLLVALDQVAVHAIGQRILRDRGGIDSENGLLEGLQPLVGRTMVDTEDGVVFAGECVAIVVLQQRRRAHDDRRLPEILEHAHELLTDACRELAAPDHLAQLGGRRQITLRGLVFGPQAPPPVGDQIGIEEVSAEKERIVWLHPIAEIGPVILEHRARDQHADRFAADRARADLTVGDRDQVGQVEMAATELDHRPFAADQHRHQQVLGRLLFRRHPEQRIARAVEHDVPRIRLFGAAVERGEQPGGRPGGRDRYSGVAGDAVREIHRGRIAIPDLQRVDIGLVVDQIEVEQHLGRGPDRRDGGEAVKVSDQGEIGHGVEIEQPRAGDPEEVHHHQVRMPVFEQIGQAIEDIERAQTLARDQVMHGRRERLEPLGGIELHHLDPGQIVDHGQMGGEPHIDDAARIRPGLLDIGGHDPAIVLDRVDLPDDVVAEAQPVDNPVEPGQSRRNR